MHKHDGPFYTGPSLRSVAIGGLLLVAFLLVLYVASDRAAYARYERIVSHACTERAWCWGKLGIEGH